MKIRFLSLFFVLTIAGTLFASDICIKKIWYNLDEATMTAEVTFKGKYVEKDDRYKGTVTIPDKVVYQGKTYDVTSIGTSAFSYCKNVTSVTLPNTITSIGKNAFSLCYDLGKINIPESVTTIDNSAFSFCLNLMNLMVPDAVITNATIAADAFQYVPNLIHNGTDAYKARCLNGFVDGYLVYEDETKTKLCACARLANGKLKLPDTIEEIGNFAFLYCADLDALTLPNSVKNIGTYAFCGCAAILSLTVPNTVSTIGSLAFYDVPNVIYEGNLSDSNNWGAKSMNGVVDGNLVYEDEEHTILKAANCKLVGNINLPNTVITLGKRAFASEFSKTTSVMMGSSIKTIGNNCFRECNLTSVVIPATVTKIEAQAFFDCYSITSFVCEANNPPACGGNLISTKTMDGVNRPLHRILVPANSLDAYKTASEWTNYADSIFAITAETSVIGTDDIAVIAVDVTARIKWPKFDNAVNYWLEVKNDDYSLSYSFDGEGQMLSTTIFGAPRLDGPKGMAQNLEASLKCWLYHIGGLEPNTKYTVHIIATDEADTELFNKTKSFTTKKRQAIDQVQSNKVQGTKVIRNGMLYLMYNGTMYNVQGAEVK